MTIEIASSGAGPIVGAGTTGVLRLPRQVLFGRGSLESVPVLVRPHGRRALICTDATMAATPGLAALRAALERAGIEVSLFADGVPEVPLTVVDDSVRHARAARPDVIIGFGGGSSLDLAKVTALLLEHPGPLEGYYGENLVPGPVLPVVAVPTTAGTGSEVTPVAVVSDPQRQFKVGISSPYLVPAYAVVDPDLTHGCPVIVSAHSGADALAHALESLTAGRRRPAWQSTLPVFVGANRLGQTLALEAVGAIGSSLREVVVSPDDRDARTAMAHASLCAAMSFGSAGTHLGHALQYSIGAATHTSHGLGVGLLLPYVLEVCRPACTDELLLVADVLGVAAATDADRRIDAAIDEVASIIDAIGIPGTLREIGVDRADLPAFAAQTSTFGRLVDNAPVVADEALLLRVLEASWEGDRDMLRTVPGPR
ncbi:MAG: alcohol dehydrogenase [Aeromicrobium sp.]|nr:alcohol dehydrogenase [Aeromicrobium sp.]